MTRLSVERNVAANAANTSKNPARTPKGSPGRQYPISSGDTLIGDAVIDGDGDTAMDGYYKDINLQADKESSQDLKSNDSDTLSASSRQALDILGHGMKQMVHTVQKLRHLGVEDLVLPLPKIVVVGDQSTGKSSLIEGMSGIKVPRKTGTCTRCPLEIELSDKPNAAWSCKISLYYKYVYENTVMRPGRNQNAASKQRPLGPWTTQDPETVPFWETTSKAEVPKLLERAQLAILNPRVSYEEYLPNAEPQPANSCYVKFSPNVIRLKICGPGLPELAFYDLPGVINNPEDPSEGYLVHLVRNLVMDYIKQPTCINLLAMPMSDDPANSSALSLIGEVKAKDRTVGVLTKPDRHQACEDIDQWVDILQGKRHEMGHRYFVVKNNPDSNVEHETARAEERDFFEKSPMFASTLREHSSRFGTLQLQNALSQILATRVQQSLPVIVDQVQRKALQIDKRLEELPQPPQGNLPMQMLERVIRFGHALQLCIDGDSDMYHFQKEWVNLMRSFRKTMNDSRPILKPLLHVKPSVEDHSRNGPSTPTPHRNQTASILLDSDDDVAGEPSSDSRKRPLGGNVQTSPAKRLNLYDIPLHTPSSRSGSLQNIAPSFSKVFTFPEINQYLQDTQGIGLPGQNPKALERMAKACCQLWKEPLDLFLTATERLCRETILCQADLAFEQWRQTPLQHVVRQTCNIYLDDVVHRQRESLEQILCREIAKPMVLDDDALNAVHEKWYKTLVTWRRERRIEEKLAEQDTTTSDTPSKQGKVTSKYSDEQLGPDPYSQEVGAMARLKAWYEISSARFIVNICQAICCELFLKCRQGLESALREKIGLESIDAVQRCETLLAIDPEHTRERQQLQKEKETLSKAQSHLQGFSQ